MKAPTSKQGITKGTLQPIFNTGKKAMGPSKGAGLYDKKGIGKTKGPKNTSMMGGIGLQKVAGKSDTGRRKVTQPAMKRTSPKPKKG